MKKQLSHLFVGIISVVAVIGMTEGSVFASSDSSTWTEAQRSVVDDIIYGRQVPSLVDSELDIVGKFHPELKKSA